MTLAMALSEGVSIVPHRHSTIRMCCIQVLETSPYKPVFETELYHGFNKCFVATRSHEFLL